MDWLKDLKPLLDLGVTGVLLAGGLFLIARPPRWVQAAVEAHRELAGGVKTLVVTHHELAEGINTLTASMPRREEIQELLIGQEALRRESVEARDELREMRRDLGEMKRICDGRCG